MLEMNKGDKVILKGFTGIKLGVFPVASTTKKTITVLKKNGDEMVFDRKTGKQVNVEEGKEKYANSIIPDDGSFVAPSTVGAKRKSTKKAAKAKTKVEDEADDEDDEDDEDEVPKKSKKAAKKPAKKSAPVEDDEDDDEDDEPTPVKKPAKKSKKPVKKGKKAAVDDDYDDDDDEFEEVDD